MLRQKMIFLLRLKFYKIPFHEKLPKDSQFYRHYVNNLNVRKLKESTNNIIDRNGMLFRDAIEVIERDHQLAAKSQSPRKKYTFEF